MTLYIQTERDTGQNFGKADYLLKTYPDDVIEIPRDELPPWKHIPDEVRLVCVVTNVGAFEAVAVAVSEYDYKAFIEPRDDRPKRWLLMDTDLAEYLTT